METRFLNNFGFFLEVDFEKYTLLSLAFLSGLSLIEVCFFIDIIFCFVNQTDVPLPVTSIG